MKRWHANDVLFMREGHFNAIKSIAEGTQGGYIHLETRCCRAFLPTAHCCTGSRLS
ncbi:hypothetical protein [Hymenobacter bucti]|uniref:hypothetical protein n=1 Tax=Hymenobacter bucti TaxID=1844114 RepID=UPI0036D26515